MGQEMEQEEDRMSKAVIFILICIIGFISGWAMGQKTGLQMAIDMIVAAGAAEWEEDDDTENSGM